DSDYRDPLTFGSGWARLSERVTWRSRMRRSPFAVTQIHESHPKGLEMRTIVLATQKGGSGKSTLAIGLALAAIKAGHSVRLIETDPQGTLSNWQCRRPYAEPIVEPVHTARDVEQRLQSLDRDGVTLTIVDTAGGVSATTNSAIRYADLCLIPTRLSVGA